MKAFFGYFVLGICAWCSCLPLIGGESIMLSPTWKIQPATNSRTMPDSAQWGTAVCNTVLDYRLDPKCLQGTKWSKQPFNEFNSFWYEQAFTLPSASEGNRFFLDFRRIEGDAIVFVNGEKVGELLRPGGEMEITAQVKDLKKPVQLRVFITRDYTDISRGYEDDGLRYEVRNNRYNPIPRQKWNIGITAPVRLLCRPAMVAIAGVAVDTSWRKKEIGLEIELMAVAAQSPASISAEIVDQQGNPVLTVVKNDISIVPGRSTIKIAKSWTDPKLWELDGGYLYSVRVKLAVNGKDLDASEPVKFGFREIWIDGRKIMLNGHESRLRLAIFTIHSKSANRVDFFRQMGYNAAYVQANPGLWWGPWSETPIYDEEMLDEMDRNGFAVFLPCPSVAMIREKIFQDVDIAGDYEREMTRLIRRYRNHPSILGWIVDMNSYANEWKGAVAPQQMGRRYSDQILSSGQPKAIMTACRIANKVDPSRVAFSCGDGNIPSIGSTCMYLNFAPLQEREEWPMEWSRSGDMPYMAFEFGAPYTANFWKGKRFLPTEYFSIYFGDRAYREESSAGLAELVKNSLKNDPDGHGAEVDWNNYPMYWDFQRLFVGNTNRAFRTWSMGGGWGYWCIDYGIPPDTKNRQALYNYNNLKQKYTEKPFWSNVNFDIHRQTNRPLLAYIAGQPVHTDKTHLYYQGENIAKNLALVWDGPGIARIGATWTLENKENVLASGNFDPIELRPGDVRLTPFTVSAPAVAVRTELKLKIKLLKDQTPVAGDEFPLVVFPRQILPSWSAAIAVYDPRHQSESWLKSLGVKWREWQPDAKGVKLLIIGRNALSVNQAMPFSLAQVKDGLKVLILEQKPEIWHGLGFRTTEAMPRLAYPCNFNGVMNGLAVDDLRYWRGSPDLLPEGKNQPSEGLHAPKWTNTHAIASTVPQIPRCAGFNPLLATEFDLDYAPLLQWRYGQGLIAFSSLDFTGRVGIDPAATKLAVNVLKEMQTGTLEATCPLVYDGDPAGLRLLQRLGFDVSVNVSPVPGRHIWVLGNGKKLDADKIRQYAAAGGTVFGLALDRSQLHDLGIKSESRTIQRAAELPAEDLFRSIGPRLLRWRQPLGIEAITGFKNCRYRVIADGLLAVEQIGTGKIVFCQVVPDKITASADNKEVTQAVETSRFRLEQLLASLLTNCGAQPSPQIAARFAGVAAPSEYVPISHWYVLGPFSATEDSEKMLTTPYPGEELAIAGTPDPNVVIRRADGKLLNWTQTVKPDHQGLVNLGSFFGVKPPAVAFVASTVDSDTERDVTLRVGCDWRMLIWVNGREVFRTMNGKNKPNSYQVKIHLKKGPNTISMKIGSGSQGFGFYADLTKSDSGNKVDIGTDNNAAILYGGSSCAEEFDPYLFRYW